MTQQTPTFRRSLSAPLAPPTSVPPCRGARPGFTLVELLVTVAIIGVLLSFLAPALQRTIGSARGFKCQTALRNIAFDFALFADPTIHGSRGADSQFTNNRFRLATFQESEYGIDEFWSHGHESQVTIEAGEQLDHMRCTEIAGAITLKRDVPCTTGGSIGPIANVSFGFNARLNRAEVQAPFGVQAQAVLLSPSILEQTDVPLVWDVDGAAAQAKGVATPQFSAPAMNSVYLYANNKHWFPGARHNGTLNVAFVGGHVVSTRTPLEEPGWRWEYSPQ